MTLSLHRLLCALGVLLPSPTRQHWENIASSERCNTMTEARHTTSNEAEPGRASCRHWPPRSQHRQRPATLFVRVPSTTSASRSRAKNLRADCLAQVSPAIDGERRNRRRTPCNRRRTPCDRRRTPQEHVAQRRKRYLKLARHTSTGNSMAIVRKRCHTHTGLSGSKRFCRSLVRTNTTRFPKARICSLTPASICLRLVLHTMQSI